MYYSIQSYGQKEREGNRLMSEEKEQKSWGKIYLRIKRKKLTRTGGGEGRLNVNNTDQIRTRKEKKNEWESSLIIS